MSPFTACFLRNGHTADVNPFIRPTVSPCTALAHECFYTTLPYHYKVIVTTHWGPWSKLRENECWTTVWVMASVWPAARIQNLARDLCTNLSIRGCSLPAQNFLSQLSFYLNYSGMACDSPRSLPAEFKERPSGVMSKELATLVIAYFCFDHEECSLIFSSIWLCFGKFKKFAHFGCL